MAASQGIKRNKPLLVVLVGPTASSKSDVALCLARRLKGEIVNCDSMQIYRGMEIGTAKPTPRMRRQIRHHLLDLIRPSQTMNVERFSRLARKAIGEVARRGKVPILVGGSGLYIRAIVEGIFSGAGKDTLLRQRLEARAKKEGSRPLHAELRKVDPQAAQRIHPNDIRRIIRALEVYQKTGQPISLLQKTRRGIGEAYRALWIGLMPDRSKLYERIEARVDDMFRRGLVDEVRRLSKKRMGLTARHALGYAEVLSYLKGDGTLERTVELVKRNQRRYAKRQLSWFRQEKQIDWLTVSAAEGAEKVAGRVLSRIKPHA